MAALRGMRVRPALEGAAFLAGPVVDLAGARTAVTAAISSASKQAKGPFGEPFSCHAGSLAGQPATVVASRTSWITAARRRRSTPADRHALDPRSSRCRPSALTHRHVARQRVPGHRCTPSPITQSWSTLARVLTIGRRCAFRGLTTAPASITVPARHGRGADGAERMDHRRQSRAGGGERRPSMRAASIVADGHHHRRCAQRDRAAPRACPAPPVAHGRDVGPAMSKKAMADQRPDAAAASATTTPCPPAPRGCNNSLLALIADPVNFGGHALFWRR